MQRHTGQLEQLYIEHHQDVTRQLARQLRDYDGNAEDAVNDAWVILDRKLTEDPDYLTRRGLHSNIRGWLYTVARRELWRILRERTAGWEPPEFPGEHGQHADCREDGNADRADAQVILRVLNGRQASNLTANQRRSLTMRLLGYSYEEEAEMFGLTYRQVNRHTTEGRDRLRQLVD